MIHDGRKQENNSTITADVCIIGAGAAGITLASELSKRSGIKVVLLEAGGRNRSGKSQKMYEGMVSGGDHLPLDQARYRQFGGTTSLWGGRCVPFDPIDLEKRDFVDYSGWPISADEFDQFYQRAHTYCECGSYDYLRETALPAEPSDMIPGLIDGKLITNTLERWSPPTHFGKSYWRDFKKANNIDVYLNSVAVELLVGPNEKNIEKVTVNTISGRTFYVSGRIVILAGGGLEATRILMHSKGVPVCGGERESSWLGKGYMSHLHGVIARVVLNQPGKVIAGYEQDNEGVYCRRRLSIAQDEQRTEKLLNAYFLLDRPLLSDPSHGSAVLSLAYLLKRLVQTRTSETIGSGKYALYWSHFKNVMKGSPEVISFLPTFSRRRFLQSRRLPSVVVDSKSAEYHLYFQTEQVPDREGFVSLDSEVDQLGVPRLKLHFNITETDVDSVFRSHEFIAAELERQGCGHLKYVCDDPLGAIRAGKAVLGHHLGTTRMSENQSDGVVDRDCLVFGTSNLYIASPSVFPTCSHANPVLTIVALAVRLADHIHEKMIEK